MPMPQEVLDCLLPQNDAGAATVAEYLCELLTTMWREGESFVKRPFGNSGWQYDVYVGLIEQGLVDGELDEYGYVESLDEQTADALVLAAIEWLIEPGAA